MVPLNKFRIQHPGILVNTLKPFLFPGITVKAVPESLTKRIDRIVDSSPTAENPHIIQPLSRRSLLPLNRIVAGERSLGIVTSGVSFMHALEAAPGASVLKIGLVHPLPIERVRAFAATVDRTVVVEEGDPVIADSLLAAGIAVDVKPEMYRFGELDVARVRRIVAGDTIVSVGGEATPDSATLLTVVSKLHPGDKTQVQVQTSSGTTSTVTLTLGQLPQ